jgi:periplasmic copper chaperone A
MHKTLQTTLIACVLTASQWASAQAVEVTGAWARATVQGQKASGAFMQLTAPQGARLISVSSPVAGVAEVHEMKMEGDVMKMRALPNGLELPAGKTVALTPGGFHVMLMDLKLPLQKDTTIPMTLVFKDAKGMETKKELRVLVSQMAPAGAAMAHDGHAAHGDGMAMASDAEQITAVMKKQFDRPDAPLMVEPVTVQDNYAVAGWTQGTKGGRALLQKDKGVWFISVCAGDGLKDVKVLQTTGMSANTAGALAKAVAAAESKLSKDKLKLFASFEGMVKIGAEGHAAPAGHGQHKH